LKGTGDVIKTYSCGQALLGRGRYGERKLVNRSRRLSLPVLAEMAYLSVRKLKLLGLQKVYIILRCFPVFMVEIFMRVLVDGGIRICGIFSQMPVAHNGCKLSNCRRI
jgi:ribosomal protein S11